MDLPVTLSPVSLPCRWLPDKQQHSLGNTSDTIIAEWRDRWQGISSHLSWLFFLSFLSPPRVHSTSGVTIGIFNSYPREEWIRDREPAVCFDFVTREKTRMTKCHVANIDRINQSLFGEEHSFHLSSLIWVWFWLQPCFRVQDCFGDQVNQRRKEIDW